MTRRCVTDEQYGQLSRRVGELVRRVDEGTIPFKSTMDGIQSLIQPSYECRWKEKNGVVYFSVTSNGTTGPEWIKRLGNKGFLLENYAKSVLCSPDFKPTSGVNYEVAILKGMLFENDDRITRKIRAEASRRNLAKPHAEVACLIRDNFSDEEIEAMALWWIVVMHEPIKDSDGNPGLLDVTRNGGGHWLRAYYVRPDDRWSRDGGFAFVVSQV